MQHTDDRILEHLAGVSKATAWEIAHDMGDPSDERRVRHRCRMLANAGFVDIYLREVGLDDQYEITSWGELYLEGEVDAELQRLFGRQIRCVRVGGQGSGESML